MVETRSIMLKTLTHCFSMVLVVVVTNILTLYTEEVASVLVQCERNGQWNKIDINDVKLDTQMCEFGANVFFL